jgi:L-2-hydroxycarboxylate dehydrogenase (NAD+)
MREVCARRGVPDSQIADVVAHFLLAEMEGKPSHGITKFCFESQFFAERQGDPQVVRRSRGTAVVDARRSIGPISALHAVRLCSALVEDHGVGVVGTINSQRYGVLSDWSSRLAAGGLLAVVMNTSPPDCLPLGATRPILGVNPISFAVPARGGPFTIDMSGSVAPMGNLWDSLRGYAELRPNSFVDERGDVTDNPHNAHSALVWGGYKGLCLSMLVQFMTGSLFDFPMGNGVKGMWSTGYCMLAVKPSTENTDFFTQANNAFLDSTAAALLDGPARLPGQRARANRDAAQKSGVIQVPPAVMARLRKLAAGESDRSGQEARP